MKKIILFFGLCSFLSAGDNMIIKGKSDLSVADTSAKLQTILKEKGVKVFSVFEHSKEAKNVGAVMADTEVVVFGAPKVGTALMQCQPEIALELPLKFLIYKDGETTTVTYESIETIANRYDASKCKEIVSKLKNAQENLFKAITKQ